MDSLWLRQLANIIVPRKLFSISTLTRLNRPQFTEAGDMVIYCAGLPARLPLFKERTASINQFQIFSYNIIPPLFPKRPLPAPTTSPPPLFQPPTLSLR